MVNTRSRWLGRAAVLILIFTALLIALIAAGGFDPKPLGAQRWEVAAQNVSAPAKSREIAWLEEAVPQTSKTLHLAAALSEGEADSGYGLALGDEEQYLAVAVSPLGYVALWETDFRSGTARDEYLLQWQPWPHVKLGEDTNEIWLDVEGDRATVRVNREWLWEGSIRSAGQRVGLLVESFGDAADVDFGQLALFAGEDG